MISLSLFCSSRFLCVPSLFIVKTPFIRNSPKLLWFDRQVCFPPCVESADQRMDILEAVFFQNERHTGARILLRSGAVRNNVVVTPDVREVLFGIVRGNSDSASGLDLGTVPRIIGPRIHDRDAPTITAQST